MRLPHLTCKLYTVYLENNLVAKSFKSDIPTQRLFKLSTLNWFYTIFCSSFHPVISCNTACHANVTPVHVLHHFLSIQISSNPDEYAIYPVTSSELARLAWQEQAQLISQSRSVQKGCLRLAMHQTGAPSVSAPASLPIPSKCQMRTDGLGRLLLFTVDSLLQNDLSSQHPSQLPACLLLISQSKCHNKMLGILSSCVCSDTKRFGWYHMSYVSVCVTE